MWSIEFADNMLPDLHLNFESSLISFTQLINYFINSIIKSCFIEIFTVSGRLKDTLFQEVLNHDFSCKVPNSFDLILNCLVVCNSITIKSCKIVSVYLNRSFVWTFRKFDILALRLFLGSGLMCLIFKVNMYFSTFVVLLPFTLIYFFVLLSLLTVIQFRHKIKLKSKILQCDAYTMIPRKWHQYQPLWYQHVAIKQIPYKQTGLTQWINQTNGQTDASESRVMNTRG